MAPLIDQDRSVRFPLPDLIIRGIDTKLQAPVYLDGALVAPSAASVSVYDDSDSLIVENASGTITGNIAEYTVTAATTTGKTLADGWRVEWTLTISGETVRAVNEAALCRQVVYPMIADQDLYRRTPSLDPSSASCISSLSSYQFAIDEAHNEISLRLLSAGRRPWLILSPASLRPCYLFLSLAIVFEDLASRLANVDYQDKADGYRKQFDQHWGRLSFSYDADEDGQADLNGDGDPLRAGMGNIFLTSRY